MISAVLIHRSSTCEEHRFALFANCFLNAQVTNTTRTHIMKVSKEAMEEVILQEEQVCLTGAIS